MRRRGRAGPGGHEHPRSEDPCPILGLQGRAVVSRVHRRRSGRHTRVGYVQQPRQRLADLDALLGIHPGSVHGRPQGDRGRGEAADAAGRVRESQAAAVRSGVEDQRLQEQGRHARVHTKGPRPSTGGRPRGAAPHRRTARTEATAARHLQRVHRVLVRRDRSAEEGGGGGAEGGQACEGERGNRGPVRGRAQEVERERGQGRAAHLCQKPRLRGGLTAAGGAGAGVPTRGGGDEERTRELRWRTGRARDDNTRVEQEAGRVVDDEGRHRQTRGMHQQGQDRFARG
mmetsp:Transcript_3464/g.10030  ORF Transcript_3464/g.10030 Transcript_3464/m.10030 type:complete len:286 (+) Transcript_3464:1669-2526(+)